MLYTQKVIDNHYNIYQQGMDKEELPIGVISCLEDKAFTVKMFEGFTLSCEELEWVCEEIKYLNSLLNKNGANKWSDQFYTVYSQSLHSLGQSL